MMGKIGLGGRGSSSLVTTFCYYGSCTCSILDALAPVSPPILSLHKLNIDYKRGWTITLDQAEPACNQIGPAIAIT